MLLRYNNDEYKRSGCAGYRWLNSHWPTRAQFSFTIPNSGCLWCRVFVHDNGIERNWTQFITSHLAPTAPQNRKKKKKREINRQYNLPFLMQFAHFTFRFVISFFYSNFHSNWKMWNQLYPRKDVRGFCYLFRAHCLEFVCDSLHTFEVRLLLHCWID